MVKMAVKRLLTILLYAIIIIILFSVYVLFMSVKPRKFSTSGGPGTLGLEYEDVTLKTSDNLKLSAWFIPAKNKTSDTIIVTHGYPFDKANVLPVVTFLRERYNILMFDFRYFGGSEGSFTTVGYHEKKDLLAAIYYLKQRNKKGKIGVWGISLGASTAIMTATKTDDIKAIVADSAYASLDRMVKQTYRIFWFLKYPFVWTTEFFAGMFLGFNVNDVNPLGDVGNVNAAIFFIHGKKDLQIPFENSEVLYDAAKDHKELWLVEGTGHCQAHAAKGKEYEERVLDFYDKYLK